jgi:hypothetical protein
MKAGALEGVRKYELLTVPMDQFPVKTRRVKQGLAR